MTRKEQKEETSGYDANDFYIEYFNTTRDGKANRFWFLVPKEMTIHTVMVMHRSLRYRLIKTCRKASFILMPLSSQEKYAPYHSRVSSAQETN